MPVIRDTEIEQLMRDYATPILKAAGLAKQNVRVVILNDRAFNAFVMDGRHIFINAGALFQAKTPNEVIGVFAHETGHLADGHLMRLRERLAEAQTQSIIALLLGIGAAVAGARAGSGANVGAAAIMAPQSVIQHSHARLCAHPGRPGRPCRREVPYHDPPVGPGHGRAVQAPEQRDAVQLALYRPLSADPSDAGATRRHAGGDRPGEPLLERQGPAGAATTP